MLTALGDSSSTYYKGLTRMLREADAQNERARRVSKGVVVPFHVDESDAVALETQFRTKVVVKGGVARARLTPRVAAMVHLLDEALIEIAGASGRRMLIVDGDLVSLAARGLKGIVVERTRATARLAFGYVCEDERLRSAVVARASALDVSAATLCDELSRGGGEHYWPSVRADGPAVSVVVVNHFRTPACPVQLSALAMARRATLYGVFPFQLDMLTKSEGALECFPGRFYVDRDADVITLVPGADASMSLSHPYGALVALASRNSFTVRGCEYLCEKYMSVKGVMYYTLKAVGCDFDAPEVLRTNYFDSSTVAVTEYAYPKIRFSKEGVPVGWERAKVRIPTERAEKVMSRAMTSASAVVHPAEVFSALTDYNNMVINSLDSAVLALRVPVEDEEAAALAIALYVNWQRRAATGTFKALLSALKLRHSAASVNLASFGMLALATWWSRPGVSGQQLVDEIPVAKVLDACGNDFSVVMTGVDPWVVMEQVVGDKSEFVARNDPWLPSVGESMSSRKRLKERKIHELLNRARRFFSSSQPGVGDSLPAQGGLGASDPGEGQDGTDSGFTSDDVGSSMQSDSAREGLCFTSSGLRIGTRSGKTRPSVPVVLVDTQTEVILTRPAELTDLKVSLQRKMQREQGAFRESACRGIFETLSLAQHEGLPEVAVVDVDPVSAIQTDLDEMVGPIEHNATARGYRLAEIDVSRRVEGELAINDSKRVIPSPKWMRLPKVDMGTEGKRVPSQTALVAAMLKRNIGVPNNRGVVDLDTFPVLAVEKVVSACFKDDWKETVERHLNGGMWEPNVADIDVFLENIDERKARSMLEETFCEGEIRLDSWLLMAKGKVKPSREATASTKVDHGQTIMYLENKSTNAMYSSIMRRVKKCLDECLRPEVSLNAQESEEEHENWYNSLEPIRQSLPITHSYASDVHCYDRSQEHPALRTESQFWRILGLSEERLRIWEKEHGPKRAVAMMYGVMMTVVWGGLSGDWKTIFRNGLIELTATVVGCNLQRKDIVMLDVKGDDMDAEFSRPVMVETAVERMSLSMNLSVKFFTSDIRYMCKRFRVKFEDRWVFLPDPWACAQSVCSPIVVGSSVDTLHERWVSLGADLRHYQNGLLVDLAAETARKYYNLAITPYGMARGLSRLARDRPAYMNFFRPMELIS